MNLLDLKTIAMTIAYLHKMGATCFLMRKTAVATRSRLCRSSEHPFETQKGRLASRWWIATKRLPALAAGSELTATR